MKKILLILLAVTLCLPIVYGKASAQVFVEAGTMGDMLLFPLYDVRPLQIRSNGWQNMIVLENTSGLWTAAHLRFRSWRKSIEIYDHIILLSPYDVFWLVIERATTEGTTTDGEPYTAGDVLFWSLDTRTCLNSGLIYPPAPDGTLWLTRGQEFLLEDCGFTAANGYDVQAEMQAGHVEIIGLWQLDDPAATLAPDVHFLADPVTGAPWVVNDVYNDGMGVINVYDVMNGLFYDYNTAAAPGPNGIAFLPDWPTAIQDPAWAIPTIAGGAELPMLPQRWGVDCGNVLAAAMQMGDVATGQFQLANFAALDDFRTENWTPGPAPAVANLHRDGYDFGGIFFDADTMFWYPWSWAAAAPYVNYNWATTVGPGFRDGDDFILNTVALPDLGNPIAPAPSPINDRWSLDDVDTALWNQNMWYHYWNDAFGAVYDTDVAITFPAKHEHYFFRDWPWWNMPNVAPRPGRVTGGLYAANSAGVQLYWTDLGLYREDIWWIFLGTWDNGPVDAGAYVWDMDQNKPGPEPGTPPPGSPWHPVWSTPQPIPHEVNLIRVGEATGSGSGITDAWGILDTTYAMGQFNISNPALRNGQRECINPGATYLYFSAPYVLPPIGIVQFQLQYGAGLVRSAMAWWHFD